MHDPSILGLPPPDWTMRRPSRYVLTNEDLELLARVSVPVANEYPLDMPPAAPKLVSVDALEAKVAVLGRDRKYQTKASIGGGGDVLAKGTCVVRVAGPPVQYGIIQQNLQHRVYNHPMSGKSILFKLQLLKTSTAPSGLLACNRTPREDFFLAGTISTQLVILQPAVPSDQVAFNYNVLVLGY